MIVALDSRSRPVRVPDSWLSRPAKDASGILGPTEFVNAVVEPIGVVAEAEVIRYESNSLSSHSHGSSWHLSLKVVRASRRAITDSRVELHAA
jgi:hypothetical protein